MTSAAGVGASTASFQEAGPGASPRAALQSIRVEPVPILLAKQILVREHYLHSLPGGTKLSFGVRLGNRMLGVLTFGGGPAQAHRLVEGASSDDCLALSRLWLSDMLSGNSESRVLGIIIRALKRKTRVRFLVTYADPSQGHVGTIYQATGWIYTGLSEAMPLCDIGDGKPRHSRSLAHAYGTHSVEHFQNHGVPVQLIAQSRKHRYVYFLDPSLRWRLKVPSIPFPKKELTHASS